MDACENLREGLLFEIFYVDDLALILDSMEELKYADGADEV